MPEPVSKLYEKPDESKYKTNNNHLLGALVGSAIAAGMGATVGKGNPIATALTAGASSFSGGMANIQKKKQAEKEFDFDQIYKQRTMDHQIATEKKQEAILQNTISQQIIENERKKKEFDIKQKEVDTTDSHNQNFSQGTAIENLYRTMKGNKEYTPEQNDIVRGQMIDKYGDSGPLGATALKEIRTDETPKPVVEKTKEFNMPDGTTKLYKTDDNGNPIEEIKGFGKPKTEKTPGQIIPPTIMKEFLSVQEEADTAQTSNKMIKDIRQDIKNGMVVDKQGTIKSWLSRWGVDFGDWDKIDANQKKLRLMTSPLRLKLIGGAQVSDKEQELWNLLSGVGATREGLSQLLNHYESLNNNTIKHYSRIQSYITNPDRPLDVLFPPAKEDNEPPPAPRTKTVTNPKTGQVEVWNLDTEQRIK